MASDIYLVPGTYTGSLSWTTAAVWSTGVVPTTNDNVYLLTNNSITFDSGLSQGTVCLGIFVTSDNGPKIGGTGTNYLQIGATNQLHGVGSIDGTSGPGATRIKVNSGTWNTTINLLKTSTSSGESGVPCACFIGSGTNAFYQVGGLGTLAGIAPSETATFATIKVEGGTFIGGKGLTATNIENNGGSVLLQSGGNTVNATNFAGSLSTQGVFAMGSIVGNGGTLNLNHRPTSGTMVGSLTLNGASLNMVGNPASFSFTSFAYGSGNVILFSPSQPTFGTISLPFGIKTQMGLSLS